MKKGKLKNNLLSVIRFYSAVIKSCTHNSNKQNGFICEREIKLK